MVPNDQYEREKEVEFYGEIYLVRDNGTVYRRYRPDRRRSRFDEIWTFGSYEKKSRYMRIGSHYVHRIVAFAFNGNPLSEKHVVDHIDTDRTNNCTENLRWVSRLDNLLRHPSTRKQIISAYGSLDKFFENPSEVMRLDKSIEWLRTISKEQAEKSREQFLEWTESDGRPKDGKLVNRVYGTRQPKLQFSESIPPDIQSLTPTAVQRRWNTPAEFPSCPNELDPEPLAKYVRNLCSGAIFARNHYGEFSVEMVGQGDTFLSVITANKQEDAIKPWSVAKITLEKGKFVHEAIGTFFDFNGAKKAHYELLDIPFAGESFDDYC